MDEVLGIRKIALQKVTTTELQFPQLAFTVWNLKRMSERRLARQILAVGWKQKVLENYYQHS